LVLRILLITNPIFQKEPIPMPLTSYRHSSEYPILALTLLALLVILVISAGVTICLAPLLLVIFFILAYQASRAHHAALLQQAVVVNEQTNPALHRIAQSCLERLKLFAGSVQVFVVPSRQRNAYTFGLDQPKVVVLYSAILENMDAAELRFVIGHEMGHIALGHTWLNSLIGGMAGIPTTLEAAVLLNLAFRWWNRACEYSADRAGLLACGSLQKATTALIKLVAVNTRSQADLQRALDQIEQEDDSPLNVLAESLSTHPMIVRRIDQLKQYAETAELRRLNG
jgi:Zn-dependent protease with chaperone function